MSAHDGFYLPGGADAFYSYQSLPNKLWKKYLYAARFVNLVRAKTPKMTLYTSKVEHLSLIFIDNLVRNSFWPLVNKVKCVQYRKVKDN